MDGSNIIMAAPTTAYNNLALNAISTNSISTTHLFGKLNVDKATHLARFYLDEIMANIDGSGVKGYAGICNVGSDNYNMHSAARRGCVASGAAAGNGLIFKDGGLNTLAKSVALTNLNARIANVQLSQSVISAWYLQTDTIGIQYKNTSDVWTNWLTFAGTQAEATTATKTITGDEFDGYVAGDTIEVRAYVTNDEGTYYSSSITFMLLMASFSLKYNSTYASYANSGSTYSTVYVDKVPLYEYNVRFFETDTYPLSYANGSDAGYYIYDGYWYQIGELTPGGWVGVIDFGRALDGQWPEGDPANPATYSELVFNAYSTIGGSNACSTTESNFTRYLKVSDSLVYTDTGFGTLIPDGYYTKGTGLAKRWYQYSGGAIIDQDFCTIPE